MLAPSPARAARYRATGQGFRRQGQEAHLAAPVGEQSPLGAVDAPGVVG